MTGPAPATLQPRSAVLIDKIDYPSLPVHAAAVIILGCTAFDCPCPFRVWLAAFRDLVIFPLPNRRHPSTPTSRRLPAQSRGASLPAGSAVRGLSLRAARSMCGRNHGAIPSERGLEIDEFR